MGCATTSVWCSETQGIVHVEQAFYPETLFSIFSSLSPSCFLPVLSDPGHPAALPTSQGNGAALSTAQGHEAALPTSQTLGTRQLSPSLELSLQVPLAVRSLC